MTEYIDWINKQLRLIPTKNTSKKKNFTLETLLKKINNNNISALEFGVFKGGTINLMSKYINKVYGFDSFDGLPEDWKGVEKKGTFKLDTLPKVNKNVCLIKGLFNETLDNFFQSHPEDFSFIHIDCDLYSSTKYVFDKLIEYNKLKSGTIIVFDEIINYTNFLDGEIKALYETVINYNLNFEWIGTHGKNILFPNDINKFKKYSFKDFRNNGYQQEAAIIIL